MAEADRIAAALQYIDEQKPADPFASLKSDPIGALRSAWERKVDPIINNAKRTFATGGVLGDILRAYGEAGAPANRAVLKGMGMPYKDPAVVNTPPTLAPDNSYGNMGDATAQTFGTIIGDPLNFVQPGAARMANALKFAKPDALKMLNEMSQGARSPMDVWHGTPHRFPPTAKNPLGEFDATKIGTGEGAQAYGHGLYFAEAPATARTYSAERAYVGAAMQGKPSTINFDDPAWLAQKTIDELGDISKATSHLKMVQRTAAKQQSPETKTQVQAAIDLLESGNISTKGSLYKVDLPDEQIAKMLDWDKPLSQQSAEVKAALQAALKADRNAFGGLSGHVKFNSSEVTGADLYKTMRTAKGEQKSIPGVGYDFGDVGASNILRDLGIPGIRYLDGGSRAGGKGTSNFVVFDPKHMNIIVRE